MFKNNGNKNVYGFWGMPYQFQTNVRTMLANKTLKGRVVYHAKQRAWERYHVRFSRLDLSNIGRLVIVGKYDLLNARRNIIDCIVKYEGSHFRILYDKDLGIPRTFMRMTNSKYGPLGRRHW